MKTSSVGQQSLHKTVINPDGGRNPLLLLAPLAIFFVFLALSRTGPTSQLRTVRSAAASDTWTQRPQYGGRARGFFMRTGCGQRWREGRDGELVRLRVAGRCGKCLAHPARREI